MTATAFLPRVRLGQASGQQIQLTPEQLKALMEQGGMSPGVQSGVPTGAGAGGMQYQQPSMGPADTLVRNGAIVQMTIQVPTAMADAMKAAGQTVPEPRAIRMMVDTGASISGVKDEFATGVGLQATDSVQIGGVTGVDTRAVYAAKLVLPEDNMEFDPIEIVGMALPGQTEIDGLLGRDFLKRANLVYVGPTGSFDIQAPAGSEATSPWSLIGAGALGLAAFASLFWIARKKS